MRNLIYLVPLLFNLFILMVTVLVFGREMSTMEMFVSQLYVIPVTLVCLFLSYMVVKDYDKVIKYVKIKRP